METVETDMLCDGVVDVNGDCYQLHKSYTTWSDANDTCSSHGFRLAVVEVNNQELRSHKIRHAAKDVSCRLVPVHR